MNSCFAGYGYIVYRTVILILLQTGKEHENLKFYEDFNCNNLTAGEG